MYLSTLPFDIFFHKSPVFPLQSTSTVVLVPKVYTKIPKIQVVPFKDHKCKHKVKMAGHEDGQLIFTIYKTIFTDWLHRDTHDKSQCCFGL